MNSTHDTVNPVAIPPEGVFNDAAINSPRVIEDLLARYPELVNAKGALGRTPLFKASTAGSLDSVEMLLDAGADPLIVDDYGECPLYRCMQNGLEKIADYLWESSQSTVQNRAQNGCQLIHAVARGGLFQWVSVLEGFGADLDAINNAKQSPLLIAAHYGQYSTVEELLRLRASIKNPEHEPGALLQAACEGGIKPLGIKCQNLFIKAR